MVEMKRPRLLLFTEEDVALTRFRRRWVRAVAQLYLALYRHHLRVLLRRLQAQGYDLTLVTSAEIIEPGDPVCQGVDYVLVAEAIQQAGTGYIGDKVRRVVEHWQEAHLPSELKQWCRYRQIPLTQVARMQLAFLFYYEIMAYVEGARHLIRTRTPAAIQTVSGYSIVEQAAISIARQLGVAVKVGRGFPLARLRNLAMHLIRRREKRIKRKKLRTGARAKAPSVGQGLTGGSGLRVVLALGKGNHLKTAVPVAKMLAQHGMQPLFVYSSATLSGEEEIAAAGFQGYNLLNFLPWGEYGRMVRWGRVVSRRLWQAIMGSPAWRSGLKDEGVDLFALARRPLKAVIDFDWLEMGLCIEGLERVFSVLQPDLVLSFSDARYAEVAAILVGRRQGIPTLLYHPYPVISTDQLNTFDVAERTLVVGPYVRDYLVAQGQDRQRLVVVGDIKYDSLIGGQRQQVCSEVYQALGVGEDTRLILLLSLYPNINLPAAEKELFFIQTYKAVKQLKGVQLVIKAHPNEDYETLLDLIHALGMAGVKVVRDYNIYELMRASAFIVTLASQAGLEAMALRVPVVVMSLMGKDNDQYWGYVKEGGAVAVRLEAEILPTFSRLLDDQAFCQHCVETGQAYARRYFGELDGGAGERLASTVRQTIRERQVR